MEAKRKPSLAEAHCMGSAPGGQWGRDTRLSRPSSGLIAVEMGSMLLLCVGVEAQSSRLCFQWFACITEVWKFWRGFCVIFWQSSCCKVFVKTPAPGIVLQKITLPRGKEPETLFSNFSPIRKGRRCCFLYFIFFFLEVLIPWSVFSYWHPVT